MFLAIHNLAILYNPILILVPRLEEYTCCVTMLQTSAHVRAQVDVGLDDSNSLDSLIAQSNQVHCLPMDFHSFFINFTNFSVALYVVNDAVLRPTSLSETGYLSGEASKEACRRSSVCFLA